MPSRHLITLDPTSGAITALMGVGCVLELSPATVQTHVRNAKTKLGARTRAQAVRSRRGAA